MKRNPSGDWKIADVQLICRQFGFKCNAFGVGSHYVVSHPRVPGLLTIPSRRAIKPVYIMLLVRLVECGLNENNQARI